MDFSKYGPADPEWTAYAATLPPRPTFDSQDAEKAHYNGLREKLAAAGIAAFDGKIVTHDYTIPTRDGASIPARTYRHKDHEATQGPGAVYIHLHGGGFFFGTLASEDGICSRITADTGALVLNVDYRHTPEFAYPTMYHDVQDAFAWLHQQIASDDPVLGGGRLDPKKVVIGGISAGGQLTASLVVAHHVKLPGCEILHDLPAPAGQVLMIPPVVAPQHYEKIQAALAGPSSMVECADAPVIPAWRIKFFMDLKFGDLEPGPEDFVVSPGNVPVEKLRGLPPTTFGVCGMDPLRDEALVWAKWLAEQGVPTNIHVIPGFPHGFRANGARLSEKACKRWDDIMHGGIKWALSEPKATGVFKIKEQ
ncbi:hypothetical protein MCOR06_011576 [Pyricularia oryzae]|nr:hypothetical protein MCOR06_011576 [Pyricularia oryzae]